MSTSQPFTQKERTRVHIYAGSFFLKTSLENNPVQYACSHNVVINGKCTFTDLTDTAYWTNNDT
ncbi:hypothetical protein [Chitinophaga agri]|uniref:Uncharacterized protein n=1 Tax=Chitinophaga agri TaxID=2703787 RepID=A0A6B9ZN78_9BACT|nr:hypothetical protein [Chitinophaga agri]QHS63742.1 hypothetical protein GWR21_30425 [Chitinophaga agri]